MGAGPQYSHQTSKQKKFSLSIPQDIAHQLQPKEVAMVRCFDDDVLEHDGGLEGKSVRQLHSGCEQRLPQQPPEALR